MHTRSTFRSQLRSHGLWLLSLGMIGLYLTHCSLSLENPEDDARKKLAKIVPTTFAALEGRWDVDSTYTVFDTKSTLLRDRGIQLELFSDTTLLALDTQNIAFSGKISARFHLKADTLFIEAATRSLPTASVLADTFLVKLRFLGNYLELDHPFDQRSTFFHKHGFLDSVAQDSLLRDSLWLLKSHRVNQESLLIEPLTRDFSYLRIKSDSIFRDQHSNGVFRTDAEKLSRSGRKWTWTNAIGSREFFVDLITKDTLRVWPLVSGKPDSGFDTYTRTSRPHRFDLDLHPFLGHVRTDSMLDPGTRLVNHFGRFFDLEFGEDHTILTQTNMASLPRFQSWSIDNGLLIMSGTGVSGTKFKVDTTIPKTLKLIPVATGVLLLSTQLYMTKVDASRYAEHPLERFDQASYAHIILGMDTLRYYFSVNYMNVNPEEFEIQNQNPLDSSWLTLRINPGQESFQSSQVGFRYLMEGRTQSLGKFTCKAQPTNDLVIRLSPSSDPTFALGQIQGHCHVLTSTFVPADSNLLLEGNFRFKRKSITARQSSLWLK